MSSKKKKVVKKVNGSKDVTKSIVQAAAPAKPKEKKEKKPLIHVDFVAGKIVDTKQFRGGRMLRDESSAKKVQALLAKSELTGVAIIARGSSPDREFMLVQSRAASEDNKQLKAYRELKAQIKGAGLCPADARTSK